MKPIVSYALIFVVSLALSVLVHRFSAGGEDDQALAGGLRYSKDDIARLVEHEFAEQRQLAMLDEDNGRSLLLGPLEREFQDLHQRQEALLTKIDELMNHNPLAALEGKDLKIPAIGEIEEIVATQVRDKRDRDVREDRERRELARKEREATRRVELEKNLTDKLRLVGDQPARVMAVIDGIEAKRNKFFEDMRTARESGTEVQFDFQTMRDSMVKMQESIDTDVKAILNPDQADLYETYKKENPFTFGGPGGMRGAFRGRDGGGGGGAGSGFGRGGQR
ncbi:MAG: hypothetical protein H6807_14130 [Planctomycetes bacterium]|nr:hypothetical protein [Planctomycetota bacterium]